jgi:hypothetical protein
MIKDKRWLVSGAAVVALSAAGIFAAAPSSKADTEWEVTPTRAQTGITVSIGQCPCFRWTIQAQALDGHYETDDVLISTDAFVQFTQSASGSFQQAAAQVFKIGQIEALYKPGHIGIGFNGVQFGSDPDQGYKNLMRLGGYVLYNILQNETLRLDVHGGFNWDSFTTLTGATASRGLVTEAVALHWNQGPWSGVFDAHLGQEADSSFFDLHRMVAGVSAAVRARLAAFSAFEVGLTAQASFEHDGFRDALGLNPNNAIASLLMDISWVDRDHTN